MDARESEDIFRDYLLSHRIAFEENYQVASGDVDFCIRFGVSKVLVDVKEVRDPRLEPIKGIDAQKHIRSDIRKLRAKFGNTRPQYPVVLVTMNVSTRIFTGLTVARALLGEVGVKFDRNTIQVTKHLHHQAKRNAVLTRGQNRSISGVLVFDRAQSRHCLFLNPFTDQSVPSELFPGVRVVQLSRGAGESELKQLANMTFFNVEFADET